MNFLRDESGSVLIEFALFSAFLIFLFAGIVDYSVYIHMQSELNDCAATGAAFGASTDNQTNTSLMQIVAQYSAQDIANLSVNATYFYTCTQGGTHVSSTTSCGSGSQAPLMYVQVTTSAPIPATLRWSGLPGSLTLQGQATYRVRWVQ